MTKDEALKMAIEALEYQQKVATDLGYALFSDINDALNACKETLEQPAQEPVAYILRNEYNEYRLEPMDNLKITDFPVEVEIKLYTHPHQWQELTDDEIEEILNREEYDEIVDLIHLSRAIEQVLRNKNANNT